jgi:UDP-N-acetylglucosamine--N-acetylmuramyl-(pentapeptide) pyrophosphoryl-undecaprenol N-acetylglucosamine transferase
MKVLLAGGGTGGHIYPALSIAEAIKRRVPAVEFIFVGTEHGLEASLVPRSGYKLETISLYGFQRRLSWRNCKNMVLLAGSMLAVQHILKRFQPDVVIGTGGYVCGPVLLMAAWAGIPTLVQEQNAFPGVTNRILGRFVDMVAVGYAAAAAKFSGHKARVVVSGNPVRQDLLPKDRAAALQFFGFQPEVPTILVTGGSQGARSINQAALTLHRRMAGRTDVQLLHVTGQADYDEVKKVLTNEGLAVDDPAKGRLVLPYLHEMPLALAMTDLAISRAGAIGLAELMLLGIPSVLVPYPHASENHQEINARALESQGAAVVVKDAELSGDLLYETVTALLADQERLQKMAAAAAGMGHPNSADELAHLAVELAGRR